MKKISTFLFLLFLAMSLETMAQAPRTVLFEHFTSATCPPCATTNPIFQRFLQPYGPKVISLAFQCNIPQVGDPMYGQNTSEVGTRMTYYGINSAPNARMDGKPPAPGTNSPTHPLNVTNAILDARLAVESPIEMHVDHLVILGTGGAKDSMDITIDIKNVSGSDFVNSNYVLHTVIAEELIRFPKQAATNGETEFHTVMRKMIPSAAGFKFTETIAPGATKTIKYRAAVPTYIYSYKELAVVAYMQNNQASSKEVIQAAMSHPKEINGVYFDLALNVRNVTNKVDDCDNTFGFDLEIENLSTATDTIKTIDLIPYIANAPKTKVTWTGVLLPGQKITQKISNQTLVFGNSPVNVGIDKINGGSVKDLNVVNNTKSEQFLFAFVGRADLKEGFELPVGSTGPPPKTIFTSIGYRIFKADSVAGNNFPYAMGGFGKSRYSAFFAFSDNGASGEGYVTFDKIDLSAIKSSKLSWNYAYAVKDPFSTDKMEIEISKDCGLTWDLVYSSQGEEMKTCDPDVLNSHIPNFFLPLPTEWKAESVDISKYDGESNIVVRYKGTAGNGWAYFLDDVTVASAVATNDPGILKSMSITPNPATDIINIKVNTEENAKANISLTDINGKVVRTIVKELSAGQNNIPMNISEIPGIYILEVKTEKGVRTEKVSIL